MDHCHHCCVGKPHWQSAVDAVVDGAVAVLPLALWVTSVLPWTLVRRVTLVLQPLASRVVVPLACHAVVVQLVPQALQARQWLQTAWAAGRAWRASAHPNLHRCSHAALLDWRAAVLAPLMAHSAP